MNTSILARLLHEQDGVLSFEWTLLVVLLVVGIVSGVAAGRDVIIDELGDLTEAAIGFDQSYSFAGIPGVLDPSTYTDTPLAFTECDRDIIYSSGGDPVTSPGNTGIPGFGIHDDFDNQ